MTATLLYTLGFGLAGAAGRDTMTVQVTPSTVELGVMTPVDQLGNVEHELSREFPHALTLHLEAERSCVIQVKAEGVRDYAGGTGVQGNPVIPIDRLAWRIGGGPYVSLSHGFDITYGSQGTGTSGIDVPIDLRITVSASDPPVQQAFRLRLLLRPQGSSEDGTGSDLAEQPTAQAALAEVIVRFEMGQWLKLLVETPLGDGRVELASTADPDHQPYAEGPGSSALVRVAGNVSWKLWEGLGGDLRVDADPTRQIRRGSLEWTVERAGGVSWSAASTGWTPFGASASLLARGGPTYGEPDGWARVPLRFRLRQSWLTRPGVYQTPTLWVAAEP
ncbi:MAG: hypothetical protein ACM3UP_00785 [Methanocella sp.]